MSEKSIVVGLDVGTTKVCTIVGQIVSPARSAARFSASEKEKDDTNSSYFPNIEIIGIGTHPSHGLKKGAVVNIEKTVRSIQCSLEEAKLMAGVNIQSATIGVAGSHIYSFNSSGVVAVKSGEITESDVERVLEAAKAVVIPSDREILHVIPQEFRVDNTRGVKNPVGMCGVRLEVNVHIVTGNISLIQNLVKCVEQTGVRAEHITLQPLASSDAVLSDGEKEIGSVLIDIGGGTTDIAIWKDGSLVHSQIIPVGGNHFTNDLAVALKIPHPEAERVKINHGSVLAEKLNQSAHITVQGISGTRPREIQLSVVAEVLGARAEELFGLVSDIVTEKGVSEDITGGYVLTGGGALIKGLPQLAEYTLMRPSKIGHPIPLGGMTSIMQNPKYSTVLGLLKEAVKLREKPGLKLMNKSERGSLSDDLVGKLSKSLKAVFKEIF